MDSISLWSRRRAAPVNAALLRQKLRRQRCADDDADVEAAFAPGHSHKMCVDVVLLLLCACTFTRECVSRS